MLGVHRAAIRTADVERSQQSGGDGLGIAEPVVVAGADEALVPPRMAVVSAPDGLLVELIGPAQ